MSNEINSQKKVTRDALTYIAEIKRGQSMSKLTPSQTLDQTSGVSVDQVTEQEKK